MLKVAGWSTRLIRCPPLWRNATKRAKFSPLFEIMPFVINKTSSEVDKI
jgi:hypothetical protein